MKTLKHPGLLMAVLFIFCCYNQSNAGVKIKLLSGNLNFLKEQKSLLVEYDYSNMSVGKFPKEEDYIKKKVQEYNEKEKGKGDHWKESWFNDRAKRFQPNFETLFNEVMSSHVKVMQNAPDAKYKMIIHTVFTEPGYNITITKKPAIINLKITIVEIANPDKPVAEITLDGAPGKTFGYGDMDTGVRIAEAYEKAGKELGQYFKDEVFK